MTGVSRGMPRLPEPAPGGSAAPVKNLNHGGDRDVVEWGLREASPGRPNGAEGAGPSDGERICHLFLSINHARLHWVECWSLP